MGLLIHKQPLGGAGKGHVAELVTLNHVAVSPHGRHIHKHILKGGSLTFVDGETVGVVHLMEAAVSESQNSIQRFVTAQAIRA
jgi:hypothetical protein